MNEQQYTDMSIIPLLRRMGFIEVTNNHGISEFGKDILFSEVNKFGEKRYSAAQVKVGDISGSAQGEITVVVRQLKMALTIKFDDLITKKKQSILEIYLITSGKFTNNAKQIIIGNLELAPYLHRIHLLEGQHIEELKKRNFQEINELMMGQLHELNQNRKIADLIQSYLLNPNNRIFKLKFVLYNVTSLIAKLSGLGIHSDLLGEIEILHFMLDWCNTTISIMPILDTLRGCDPERKRLINGSKDIIEKINKIEQIITQKLS